MLYSLTALDPFNPYLKKINIYKKNLEFQFSLCCYSSKHGFLVFEILPDFLSSINLFSLRGAFCLVQILL